MSIYVKLEVFEHPSKKNLCEKDIFKKCRYLSRARCIHSEYYIFCRLFDCNLKLHKGNVQACKACIAARLDYD